MSNFIETYKSGKAGLNEGLETGIPALDEAINGLQKKQSIGVAAGPKVGKTTLCDFAFVISPYLHMERLGKLDKIRWIYHSYEIDRVSKEFKFAAFFFAYDHKIYNFMYKGKLYLMSPTYLMGKLKHTNADGTKERIPVLPEHEIILQKVYDDRIKVLFGVWSVSGKLLERGLIDFIEAPENPTGLYKYHKKYAEEHGTFLTGKYQTLDDQGKTVIKERIIGYTENDPELHTIIVTDHIRKLRRERGFTMKDNIDKYLEYSTELRNLCKFTYIHIIHSNRNLANVERLKFAGEFIFPTADDCKDSGNPAEECTIFMTLFNPNDEKYSLTKHFGKELANYPFYRSLHITESRETECPLHIQFNMLGNINMFTPI